MKTDMHSNRYFVKSNHNFCPWNNISSFLSLSFSNKDLFLSSREVDLPTLLLLYRFEFLFILLFTFGLWILFPPVLPLPLASRSCLFYSTCSLLKNVKVAIVYSRESEGSGGRRRTLGGIYQQRIPHTNRGAYQKDTSKASGSRYH